MKKDLLKTGFLAGALLFGSFAKSQVTEGGKPFSFGKFFQQKSMVPVVHMPAFDLDALLEEDAINDGIETKPFRFGYNHYTNLGLYNSGIWTTLENGDRLWQLQVKSQGALTVNLAFKEFNLPKGAKLYVYTPDHEAVIGAMTSANNQEDGEQATDLLPGEEVILEYYEPAAVAGQGSLNLWRVTHGYRSLSPFVEQLQQKSFGDAGSCQINVKCALGVGWEDQIRSVACIVVGGSEACTGALVNNTANDGTPYFLTANHCYSAGTGSWVFRFNWQSSGCTSPGSSPSSNSVTGATLRARNAGSDFCLLQLNTTPPAGYGVYYAGWSRSATPTTNTTAIHHPSGDIKKISTATGTVAATWSGAQCWDVGIWTNACTEPGSSGSPLFDENHRVIGQLYGGPSACGATGSSLKDYYGRFDISWTGGGTSATRLSNWLDPVGSAPTTVDGYDPNAVPPAYADDAGIPAISSPAASMSTCATTINQSVTIKNFGSDPLTSATINYQLDFGPTQTQPWTGSLATNASASVTLPALTGLSVGSHTLIVYTTNPNGVADPNTVNDQTTVNFTVIAPTPTGTLPVSNGFQTGFPGTGFSVTNGGATAYTWVVNNSVGGFGATTKSAYIDNYSDDFNGDSDYLNTAYLDFTSVSSAVQMTFDVAYAPYSATYKDSLKVWISTNCGTPALAYAKGYTSLGTAPVNNSSLFVPTAAQWRTETINMSSYAGMSNVRVSFENKSGYGQPIYIDNINISAATGVVGFDLDGSVQMFPNPAGTNVNISLPLAFASYNISVANGLGQQVLAVTASGNALQTSLDVSSLNPGVYFVTIQNGVQKTVKKLVKE